MIETIFASMEIPEVNKQIELFRTYPNMEKSMRKFLIDTVWAETSLHIIGTLRTT